MKILFVCDAEKTSNPFVHTLIEELTKQGVEAIMSCQHLWNEDDFDIIHFQWPEAVFTWAKQISVSNTEKLCHRLSYLKRRGVKIAITCHNLKPHTITDKGVTNLYGIIYSLSDLFIHLGSYSYSILSKEYPKTQHLIIPHHIYDSIYNFKIHKDESRNKLKLPINKIIILCFGEFRTDEERELIIQLKEKLKNKNILFLVPGFYRKHWYSRNIKTMLSRIKHIIHYKLQGIKFSTRFIDNPTTEMYFSSADIVMIQRFSILNSGNLPMGFHAGKVVIGTTDGNVGSILKETGNPTFNPKDIDSVLEAISQAIILNNNNKGLSNKNYALKNWNTSIVVKQLISAYKAL